MNIGQIDRGCVLYVSSVLPARSETFVYREIFALRDRGIRVGTATVRSPRRGLGDRQLDRLADEAVPIYGLGMAMLLRDAVRALVFRPVRSIRTILVAIRDSIFERDIKWQSRLKLGIQVAGTLALAARLQQRGLKVIHVHAHMAHVPSTFAMYLARWLGVQFSFTGHAADLFRDRCLLDSKLRRCSFVACISLWHREFYQQVGSIETRRLPIVRCGIDVTDFKPMASVPMNSSELRLLAVGRLVEKKGFDDLLHAIHQLVQRNINVKLTLVGDGLLWQKLTELVSALNLQHCVEMTGELSNQEVRRLMLASDLFVLPCKIARSGDRDGVPVVLMEAMACGLCVVSGDLPAIRELVKHEVTGLLVSPGDIGQLADTIMIVSDAPDYRKALAESGRARIEEEFSLCTNVDRLLEALSRCFSQSQKRNTIENTTLCGGSN